MAEIGTWRAEAGRIQFRGSLDYLASSQPAELQQKRHELAQVWWCTPGLPTFRRVWQQPAPRSEAVSIRKKPELRHCQWENCQYETRIFSFTYIYMQLCFDKEILEIWMESKNCKPPPPLLLWCLQNQCIYCPIHKSLRSLMWPEAVLTCWDTFWRGKHAGWRSVSVLSLS